MLSAYSTSGYGEKKWEVDRRKRHFGKKLNISQYKVQQ